MVAYLELSRTVPSHMLVGGPFPNQKPFAQLLTIYRIGLDMPRL